MKSHLCTSFRRKRGFVWSVYFGIILLICITYSLFYHRNINFQINEAVSRMSQDRPIDNTESEEKTRDLNKKGSRNSIPYHRGKLSPSRARPGYVREMMNSLQEPIYKPSTLNEVGRGGLSPSSTKVLPRTSEPNLKIFVQDKTVSRKQTANQTPKENTKDIANTNTQSLIIDLKNKLQNVLPGDIVDVTSSCDKQLAFDNSCDQSGCLRLQLPKSPESRIEQLVKPPHLHPSDHYVKIMGDMRDSVPGYYDIIFATAASSNHYLESMALLYNLKKNVFPFLKNYTLVYYDIGLSGSERENISKICVKACHVRKYPFSNYPEILSFRKCYAWKPTIVYAHASRCNLLFWVDASIRFLDDSPKLNELLHLARVRGMQTGSTGNRIPRVTLVNTFHFFGDEPCAYHGYRQCTAAIVIFKNEPLIRQAVIEPWVACALNASCMCPHNETFLREARWCGEKLEKSGKYQYGLCHRFDQSALSIVTRKLFQEKSHHLLGRNIMQFLTIERGDKWTGEMEELDPPAVDTDGQK